MFRHPYRYWFIIILSLYTLLNTLLCEVYYYFKIEIEWYFALITIFLCTLLTWEGNRLVEPVIRKFVSPLKGKLKFLVLFFLVGNLIAVVSAFIPVYIIGRLVHSYSWSQNINPLKLNIIYTVLVNLFFHLLNAIYFFFLEYQRHWKEAEELRKISTQARVQQIMNQINPHFLFNNLNVLSGMVIKDNPDANRFIEEFSKVYRYVLNNQEKELVELRIELELIEPYLFLLNKRFDTGLVVTTHIPDQSRGRYIVPIALQMLIENAIKHNIVARNRPLHIDITVNENETLTVSNNLQHRKVQDSSTHIGLENIRKRYELICGKEVVINKTASSFEVTLPLIEMN